MYSQDLAASLEQAYQTLSKSMTALGIQGLTVGQSVQMGQIGVMTNVESEMESLVMDESELHFVKECPVRKTSGLVYQYRMKTASGTAGLDLFGTENSMPQEDTGTYVGCQEVLKLIHIRQSVGDAVSFAAEAGGLAVDPEKECDDNAMVDIARAMELAAYSAHDKFIGADGQIAIDTQHKPVRAQHFLARAPRGVIVQVRDKDASVMSIDNYFIGFANDQSVVGDLKGDVITRDFVESAVAPSRNAGFKLAECHITPDSATDFKKSLMPMERVLVDKMYHVGGDDASSFDGFTYQSAAGVIQFRPSIFKYTEQKCRPRLNASNGVPPQMIPGSVAVAQVASGTQFALNEKFNYLVQACNINGSSAPIEVPVTVTAAGNGVRLTITNHPATEYYKVFRTKRGAGGEAGKEYYIGQCVAIGATSVFLDIDTIKPNCETLFWKSAKKEHLRLAVLGSLMNKTEFGRINSSKNWAYSSYYTFVVIFPRAFAVTDNCRNPNEVAKR